MYFIGLFIVLLLSHSIKVTQALYTGPFNSDQWIPLSIDETKRDTRVSFLVALNLRDTDLMHQEFLEISNPKSPRYGDFYDLQTLQSRFGTKPSDKQKVAKYFQSIPGAVVTGSEKHGDFLRVQAPIKAIEEKLQTELAYWSHMDEGTVLNKAHVRAVTDISIPYSIQEHISFISLNAPILSLKPRVSMNPMSASNAQATTNSVSINPGNQEALVFFTALCGDGSVNNFNPPCSNLDQSDSPYFKFQVTEREANISNPYTTTTNPLEFDIYPSDIYCYDTFTKGECTGRGNASCVCIAKLSPLPMYTQLQVNVSSTFPYSGEPDNPTMLGVSPLFSLTDVATSATLSFLYNIPAGMKVRYGSNQSVVEFYNEFYSNADLLAFLKYSGLGNATIPDSNVFGNLPNDQSSPGGEAQLDVEYIMALAPGAETFFYSFSSLNPYDDSNEGFLAYLEYVSSQENPPLVHSLSYGDVEASVFNASNNGSSSYGYRCDQEFMKMGLRGLTVIFSSGDDGIGNFIVRDNPDLACSKAYPSWPAASPYVTSVGATQLYNEYLPVCEASYGVSTSYPHLPQDMRLQFQCTAVKETTCSSTIGGVITSGGGFSDVSSREYLAPWQIDAVNKYLSEGSYVPPYTYFNSSGRAYPDVATYGSNYFVYLNSTITRESGTSASAPVFAAMVTLWNDMRLAYGYSPMGFIAPFLYEIYASHPEAFHDITTGNNACGAGHSLDTVNCCDYSFSAAPGWDAVTGLGSPNFEVIANLVLNSSTPFPAISASAGLSESTTVDSDSSDDSTSITVALALGIYATIISTVVAVLVVYAVLFPSRIGLKEPLLDTASSRGLTGSVQ